MPPVRTKDVDEVAAVFCADLHLTLLQPACRADDDWQAVQAGYLAQLAEISPTAPIICAGDIFDKWNTPPELINFALKHLPDGMYCVPGQHDLPNHLMKRKVRSGYGVLKEVGKIHDLSEGNSIFLPHHGLYLNGFGWDEEITPPTIETSSSKNTHVAVIHRYCWEEGLSYPGAPMTNKASAFKKALKGYEVAVFGDNHKGFLSTAGDCIVLNCGGFIRRKSDEIDYVPKVGVLLKDGRVRRVKLNTTGDRFHSVGEGKKDEVDLSDFIEQLEGLGEQGLDFRVAVEHYLSANVVDAQIKQIILQSLEA